MAANSIWTEETSVRISETDFQQRWRPSNFFQAMQEAAAHHASSFGFSHQSMLAQEMIWLLSRMKIYFHRFPVMDETVVIRTWPKGIQQKLFFMRDFEILSKNGERFATATSAWLLINSRARRILLPQSLPGKVPDNGGFGMLDEQLEKIAPVEELSERLTADARFSAVDLMGHVNNARYVDWICDCFPFEQYASKQIEHLQINYVNEVKSGEQVSITAGQDHQQVDRWMVVGANISTGARAFEAEVRWSN